MKQKEKTMAVRAAWRGRKKETPGKVRHCDAERWGRGEKKDTEILGENGDMSAVAVISVSSPVRVAF